MDADRAGLLGEADDRVLDVGGRDHHQVGELVDDAEDVGQRLLAAARAHLVHLDQVARAGQRHVGVALLHLAHEVLEGDRGLLRARDHRREQVRDRVVVVELDLLGVDEHEPHLVRRRAEQDRREHRVDAARLARAGGARHEQVRHLGEVGADGAARDVLAEPDRERRPALGRRLEDVAEVDDAAARVRDLDADGLLARDRGEDADVGGGERVGEVVLELGDLADLDAGREPELVAGDVRPGDHPDDLGLHAEVAERLDQLGRGLLLPGRVGPVRVDRRAGQEARVGDRPDELRRVGDRGAVAAAGRELLLLHLAARAGAHDAGLVGLRVLGEPRRLVRRVGLVRRHRRRRLRARAAARARARAPAGAVAPVEVGEALRARPEVLLARGALRGPVAAGADGGELGRLELGELLARGAHPRGDGRADRLGPLADAAARSWSPSRPWP